MRHPYADFLHLVDKPARYTGGEFQSVRKAWDSVEATLCLAFPDLYDLGMSHLGTKILYSLINNDPRLLCERAFTPWVDMERELRARSLPLLSLESARPLKEFDVVGISLQYELTFTNALLLLDLSAIPLRAEARGDADPLIIGGGPTATHPEAVAPFFDAFLLGDAEERLPEIVRLWGQLRRAGTPRQEALAQLAQIGGIYVPQFYKTVYDPASRFEVVEGPTRSDIPARPIRQVLEDINRYPFPSDSPVAVAEAVFDRMSIEIARGCTEGCRFCQAGMIYRPVRERDPQQIIDTIVAAIQKGGYDEVSLTSLSTADYSCISPLLKQVMARLREERVSLSVSSLRAYGLSEDLLDEIQTVRATGLTFAPEAGSQRMRDVIAKNIKDEDLLRTAHRVFSRGWSKMKLYFMIGLPTEGDEDVVGIIETGAKMRDAGLAYWRRNDLDVTCSVSTHVPKPHTPFQWCAFNSMEEIHRKHRLLETAARARYVKLKYHEAKGSYLEAILGRADRRVADVVELAFRKGCRFDGWDEQLKFDKWQEALKECGLDPAPYLEEIPVGGRLPWDHLDMQLDPEFLVREHKKAIKSRTSPPCGKAVGDQVHHTNLTDALAALQQKLVCYDCGLACDLVHMKEERIDFLSLLGATEPPAPKEAQAPAPRKHKAPPPPKFEQMAKYGYRVRFQKIGKAALGGHLDLVRNLPRVLRRAGLEMYYSQGFHPKPSLIFGPALKLGIESLCEFLDLELVTQVEPSELAARLSASSPEGIVFTGARALLPKEPSIARAIQWAEYLIASPMPKDLDLDVLRARCQEASSGAPVLVSRETKPKDRRRPERREVDVAPFIGGLWLSEPAAARPLEIPADRLVLKMKLRVNAEGNARPEELLSWLGGGLELVQAVRLSLYGTHGEDPLAAPVLPALAEATEASAAHEATEGEAEVIPAPVAE